MRRSSTVQRGTTAVTDVIFRKFKDEGDIIALFPGQAWSSKVWQCASYQRVGQHGGADVNLVMTTAPATPEEYKSLKAELERIGYKLKVVKRFTKRHYEARLKEID